MNSDSSSCVSISTSETLTEISGTSTDEQFRNNILFDRPEGGDIGINQGSQAVQTTPNHTYLVIRQSLLNFLAPFAAKALAFIQRHHLLDFLPNSLGVDLITQAAATPKRYVITESLKRRMKRCNHPSHKNLNKTALIREMPIAYFELFVQDLGRDRNLSRNEVANANFTMNSQFVKRLTEIEAIAPYNVGLKLLTFQEWVDMLLKINKALIKNMHEIETELLLQTQVLVNGNATKTEQLDKCRRDIARLVQVIQKAYIAGNWNVNDMNFETLKKADIFGRKMNKLVT